ncbi:DKNYY domain-containing protein [Musicola keenii]|uniref:DKNYY domain-containing protein n=1 Tax=Musicola keenii TaxID=2884250 RepID=UPI0017820664|nr:DKNYY domain-containing protein [Musicola keenii]
MKRIWLSALSLGMVTLSSYADVPPPYKVVDGKVALQISVNVPAQVLPGAKPENFRVLQKSRGMILAASGNNFYCNQRPLPAGFNAESARIRGEFFLVSNVGSYLSCERMNHNIDANTFQALDFPFFRDRTHVWLPDGETLEGVDADSFKSIGRSQAFDKKNYYYAEREITVTPYSKKVAAFGNCFGWASVDGVAFFRGESRKDVDVASFRCLTFNAALDKQKFYVFDRVYPGLPAGVNVEDIKVVRGTDKLVTDGKRVWFLGVEPVLLSGLKSDDVKLKSELNGYTISDGATRWQCGKVKIGDNPLCSKG